MRSITLSEIVWIVFCFYCSTVSGRWRVFETEPQNTTVTEGSSVVLKCKVIQGYYPVYWENNGHILTPDTTQTQRYKWMENKDNGTFNLKILKASKEDEGTYICLVHFIENPDLNERSRPGSLTVIQPPSFIEQPQNKTVAEGGNVTLNCHVGNFTQRHFDVFWMKNGARVLSKNHLINTVTLPDTENSLRYSVPYIAHDKFNLKITNVFLEDAGDFECFISLKNSTNYDLKSRPGTLFVLDVNCSVESTHPNKSFYEEGDVITTFCSIRRHRARSDMPVILSWLRKGMEFPGTKVHGMNLRIQDNWPLTANDDNTHIACRIQLIESARISFCQTGPIRVLYAPMVSVVPFDPVVLQGENLTFTCISHANPGAVNYKWFLNDTVISDEDISFEVKQGGQTLTIHAITEIYNGIKVDCMARNAVATRSGSARIRVMTFDNTEPLICWPSVVVLVVLVVITAVMGGVICYFYRSLKKSRREVKKSLRTSSHPTHRDISSTIATNPEDKKSNASDVTDDPECQYTKLDSMNLQTTYTSLIAHKLQGCSETAIVSASQDQEEAEYEQVDGKHEEENNASDCSDNLS